MKILGVDSGVYGGLAIVTIDDGAAPQLVDAIDIPVAGGTAAPSAPSKSVIACCEIPTTIVEPSMWKKFHRLHGGDKEADRQRALHLFPAAHALLARKRDHGRADAALIALAGAPR